MAVESRAERGPAVVQVEGEHSPTPEPARTLLHGAPVAGARAKVVAAGEEVAGVQADADASGRVGADNRASSANVRPIECPAPAVFSRATTRILASAESPRPGRRRRGDPGLEPFARVGAGVDHDAGKAQGLARSSSSVNASMARAHAAGPGREIDEIARVGEDRAGCRSAGRRRRKAGISWWPERPRRPLALILQEDLHGPAPEIATPLQGLVQAARNRHVGPEVVGGPRRPRGRGHAPSADGAGRALPAVGVEDSGRRRPGARPARNGSPGPGRR